METASEPAKADYPDAEVIDLPDIVRAPQQAETLAPLWVVIIHNDEITTFEFVINVLQRVFLLSEEIADHIAHTTHEQGRAIVVVRPRAEAKRLIDVAHGQARAAGFPLTFTMELET